MSLIRQIPIKPTPMEMVRAFDEITTKSKKVIVFSDEMKAALEDYFNDLKSRCSSFTNRTKPLFPNYRTVRKLRLHWIKFDTDHSQIKRDGKLYKEAEEQRRYEERIRIRRDSDSENDHVDMICDIDDDD